MICIVSGGQTGVDRGALDAALAAGASCGGWCPAGRKAEDGRIPARYPVRELPGADYSARTRRNVQDSEGTLILRMAGSSEGTELTASTARRRGKPLLCIDARETATDAAIDLVTAFVRRHGIGTLNVAGPRASQAPEGHDYAQAVIMGLLAGHVTDAATGPDHDG